MKYSCATICGTPCVLLFEGPTNCEVPLTETALLRMYVCTSLLFVSFPPFFLERGAVLLKKGAIAPLLRKKGGNCPLFAEKYRFRKQL